MIQPGKDRAQNLNPVAGLVGGGHPEGASPGRHSDEGRSEDALETKPGRVGLRIPSRAALEADGEAGRLPALTNQAAPICSLGRFFQGAGVYPPKPKCSALTPPSGRLHFWPCARIACRKTDQPGSESHGGTPQGDPANGEAIADFR